jgi:hypothetical protein
MILKTTLLAALGALFIAAPAAVQAQPSDSDSYYYQPSDSDSYYYQHSRYHYHHSCGLIRRGEYGLFGRYRERWTLGCE